MMRSERKLESLVSHVLKGKGRKNTEKMEFLFKVSVHDLGRSVNTGVL